MLFSIPHKNDQKSFVQKWKESFQKRFHYFMETFLFQIFYFDGFPYRVPRWSWSSSSLRWGMETVEVTWSWESYRGVSCREVFILPWNCSIWVWNCILGRTELYLVYFAGFRKLEWDSSSERSEFVASLSILLELPVFISLGKLVNLKLEID